VKLAESRSVKTMRNDHRVTPEALQSGHTLTLSIIALQFLSLMIIFVHYSHCCLAN